jgi:hypothetical protein
MTPGLPSGWVGDTLGLYARAFGRGARLALANWPAGLVIILYGKLLEILLALVAPLGLLGGLLVYLASVACSSSALALVEQVIRAGRVSLRDLPAGFAAYLGDLLTAIFLLWGLGFVASLVLRPTSTLLYIVFLLATFVFFNALPELIYLGRHAATELLVESYRFIGENWIEWFPANLALVGCVLAVSLLPGGRHGLVADAALGLVLYFAMIARGLLFQELSSSNRRARAFRRAAG